MPPTESTFFSPIYMRNPSLKRQIIWCADILPHKRLLSARTLSSRRAISSLSFAFRRFFMETNSIPQPPSSYSPALPPSHPNRAMPPLLLAQPLFHLATRLLDALRTAPTHRSGRRFLPFRCPPGQPFKIKHIVRTGAIWLLPPPAQIPTICLILRGRCFFQVQRYKTVWS